MRNSTALLSSIRPPRAPKRQPRKRLSRLVAVTYVVAKEQVMEVVATYLAINLFGKQFEFARFW